MKIITRLFYVFTVLLFAGMIYVHKFDTSFAVKNSQENIELGKPKTKRNSKVKKDETLADKVEKELQEKEG